MATIRIQLVKDSTNKNPVASSVILVNKKSSFKDLIKGASSKFKISPSKIRLFLAKSVPDAKVGTEIINDKVLNEILEDDIMIAVSNGEDFKRGSKQYDININTEILKKIPALPRHPTLLKYSNDLINGMSTYGKNKKSEAEVAIKYTVNLKDTNYDKQLSKYNFPILIGNVLDLIKKTVASYKFIREIVCNGYISFDYDDNAEFLEGNDWTNALVRECRGIIISTETGFVLARRFHKFFNISEKSSSLADQIDFDGAKVYNKLDGTLVSPIILNTSTNTSTLIWATRRMRSTEVENYVNDKDYIIKFAKLCLDKGLTPLFEFVHNEHAVGLLLYPEKKLILLNVRNNETGEYVLNDLEKYEINIPELLEQAEQVEFTDVNELFHKVTNLVGREGIVIYTKSNELFKFKSHWYISMIKAQLYGGTKNFILEVIKLTKTLRNVPANKIFYLAIENSDDLVASCFTLLNEYDRSELNELKKFISIIQQNIKLLHENLKEWFLISFKVCPNKEYLLDLAQQNGYSTIVFDENINNLKTFLLNFAKKECYLDMLEELLDISWSNCITIVNDKETDLIKFDQYNNLSVDQIMEIKEHVLTKYLPKKIKQIFNCDIINVHKKYLGSEGKLIGFWEQFIKYDIYDLRIDLQPQKKDYDAHNGNSEYALFLVQYGLPENNKSKPFGSFAGVLIPTECDIMETDFISAFEKSFETQKIIKMKRRTVVINNNQYKLFCDLDGVLVDFEKGVLDLTGKTIDEQLTSKLWQRILNCPNFFENLDFLSYGKDLWTNIVELYGDFPTILTGIPTGTGTKKQSQHAQEKERWCKKNLSDLVKVITCPSQDKYKFASENYVLIDDRFDLGQKWKSSGGIFIHHFNPNRTLYELKRLFGKIQKTHLEQNQFNYDNIIAHTNSHINDHNCMVLSESNCFWPANFNYDSKVFAIDSEHDPNGQLSNVSIVQISYYDNNNENIIKTLIVDMQDQNNEIVKERLYDLLMDKTKLKICFGLKSLEATQIGTNIMNLIDLQEVAIDNFDNFSPHQEPSLSTLAKILLNKNLDKSQQTSDWRMRPLTNDQIVYAATDSFILIELYNKFLDFEFDIISKNIFMDNSKNDKKKCKLEINYDIPVRVLYSCIFLSTCSKIELLKLVEPLYKNIYGSLVRIINGPSEHDINSLQNELNDSAIVTITCVYNNKQSRVQFVTCNYKNKNYFILISSDQPIINDVTFHSGYMYRPQLINEVNITLYGQIGFMVQYEQDDLCTLSEKIKEKIKSFQENALPNETLKFKQNELSAYERSVVHEYAKNNNMDSESTGKEGERKLTLTMKRKNGYYNYDSENKVKIEITDKNIFQKLKLISNETNIVSAGYLINNIEDEVRLEFISTILQKRIYAPNKKMIILRGLPGSGKSTFTKIINEILQNVNKCSADDYFTDYSGNYNFDKSHLEDAHNYCFELCKSLCESNDPMEQAIIIDNTNSTLNEYKKYINLAKDNLYDIIIVEISCKNKDQAIMFASRCTHNIDKVDCLKMFARWQRDDNAFLITTQKNISNDVQFNEQTNNYVSFNKWLEDNKVCHNNKSKNKTHIMTSLVSRNLTFLDIPDEIYDDFLEAYLRSGISPTDYNEPKYIGELPTHKFKMFFDIDYYGSTTLDKNEIKSIIRILHELIKGNVYVTNSNCNYSKNINNDNDNTNTKIKTGIHLICETIVDLVQAIDLRNNFVNKLNEKLDPNNNWEHFIDSSVYSYNTCLRMIGSRKSTKDIDVGRIKEFMMCIADDGSELEIEQNTIDFLKKVSIRI
jgi:T4 RnlA family RNA ligase